MSLPYAFPQNIGYYSSISKFQGIALPHSNIVLRIWESLKLDAVLYVGGNPAAYFKKVQTFEPTEIVKLHRCLWNHHLAPLFVISSPQEVRLYSARALPAKENEDVSDSARLIKTIKIANDTLAVDKIIHSIETGQIYADHPKSFMQENAVDRYLLRNLSALRFRLTSGKDGLNSHTVHCLLTRLIFTCYLIDRGIANNKWLKDGGLSEFRNTKNDPKKLLYGIFDQLKTKFNGSMFDQDLRAEQRAIRQRDIESIQGFLKGDSLGDNQLSLGFWAYDFSIIPIEMISAIYEDFIDAEGTSKRRTSGAYYTPPHVAEMVLDVASENNFKLLGKTTLDPACGSGIFLVAAFNRMAAECRMRNPNQKNHSRYKSLLKILKKYIFGLDVSEAACRVACFSLYLALLDQLNPRDIRDLERSGDKLPILLQTEHDQSSKKSFKNIICGNFFNETLPLKKRKFNLLIGNPPWVSRGNSTDELFLKWRSSRTPDLVAPERQMACGFMWDATEFLTDSGYACFLLPSSVLLNTNTNNFQKAWFEKVNVEKIVQLCDLSLILFTGAKRPATIIKFRAKGSKRDRIEYDVPKASSQSIHGGPVIIYEEDRKCIPIAKLKQALIAENSCEFWKSRLWGTPRDIKLLDRLRDMDSLAKIVGSPQQPRRWIAGQGFQPFNPDEQNGSRNAIKAWWRKDALFLDAKQHFHLIVDENDLLPIGKTFNKLRRLPDRKLFEPPMVLVSQGISKAAYCNSKVLFRDSLQSIKALDPQDADKLVFLSVVLNSKLATYFFFHTASNWGTEREKVHLSELLKLPFPLPESTISPDKSRAIIADVEKIMREQIAGINSFFWEKETLVKNLNRVLEPFIFDYYGIDEFEKHLIYETDGIFVPSARPSLTSNIPTLQMSTIKDRHSYLDILCDRLNAWFNSKKITGQITADPVSGMAIVTLSRGRRPNIVNNKNLTTELHKLQKLLPVDNRSFIKMRGMKIFDGYNLYILKPLILKSWTITAALNDSDEIAASILSAKD